MRYLILSILFVSCAKENSIQDPVLASTPQAIVCNVIDKCTYDQSLFPKPIFNCREKIYQLADPAIDPTLFLDKTCLTTREDWHTEQAPCGPMNMYLCPTSVQGPGPKAI